LPLLLSRALQLITFHKKAINANLKINFAQGIKSSAPH